jgi:hypothetical protein
MANVARTRTQAWVVVYQEFTIQVFMYGRLSNGCRAMWCYANPFPSFSKHLSAVLALLLCDKGRSKVETGRRREATQRYTIDKVKARES